MKPTTYPILLFLLIFFSSIPSYAAVEESNLNYEQFIEQYKNTPLSILELTNELNSALKLNGAFISINEKTIYYTLLANAYANQYDKINAKSDDFFLKSLKIWKEEEKKSPIYIWSVIEYANYLYNYRDLQKAMYYYSEASELLKNIDPERLIHPCYIFKSIGFFLGTIEEISKGIEFLELANKSANQHLSCKAEILNNIGLYYYRLNEKTKALNYYNQAEKMAIAAKDNLRYAKILGSKADFYTDQGLYKRSLNYLEENLAISKRSDSPMHLMFVNRQIALLYMKMEDYLHAEKYLDEALRISKTKDYLRSDEYDILKLKISLNHKLHKSKEDHPIFKRLFELEDSIKLTDGENALNLLNVKYQKNIYEQRVQLNQSILEKQKFQNQIILVISLLLLVILGILIRAYRLKLKNRAIAFDQEILQLEVDKLISDKRLAETSKDLNSYRTYLYEKKLQIAELNHQIEIRNKNSAATALLSENKLEDLLKSHLMTEESWQSFKQAFIKEYPVFYTNIKKHYPALTESNLRIIFLTKLELNNYEIANLLGVSYDAVKKAKQRLKKKVDEDSVEDFIKSLDQ